MCSDKDDLVFNGACGFKMCSQLWSHHSSCYLSGCAHDLSCTQSVRMVGPICYGWTTSIRHRIYSRPGIFGRPEDLRCVQVLSRWCSTKVLRQGLQSLIDGSTKVAGLWFNVTVDDCEKTGCIWNPFYLQGGIFVVLGMFRIHHPFECVSFSGWYSSCGFKSSKVHQDWH